jgi:WD40 repeat protein
VGFDFRLGREREGPKRFLGIVEHAAFSPDVARILTVCWAHSITPWLGPRMNATARLWDAASGKLIASFDDLDPPWSGTAFLEAGRPALHFSPDSARVLAASADHTAKLWDAASGKLISSFAHQDEVFQAEFSRDGARILTASGDTAKLWNAVLGKLVASFEHQDTVRWAGFSPDGTRILTVSWDKTANLWDAATPVQLAQQVKEAGGEKSKIGASVSMAISPTQQVESL